MKRDHRRQRGVDGWRDVVALAAGAWYAAGKGEAKAPLDTAGVPTPF